MIRRVSISLILGLFLLSTPSFGEDIESSGKCQDTAKFEQKITDMQTQIDKLKAKNKQLMDELAWANYQLALIKSQVLKNIQDRNRGNKP